MMKECGSHALQVEVSPCVGDSWGKTISALPNCRPGSNCLYAEDVNALSRTNLGIVAAAYGVHRFHPQFPSIADLHGMLEI